MVLERLRLRFGVIAAFVFASFWAAGIGHQAPPAPSAFEVRIHEVHRGYAPPPPSPATETFDDYLLFDVFVRDQIKPGDVITVHCDIQEDTHVCFTGTLESSLAMIGALFLTSLIAAVALLRPWLARWISRDAAPGR